MAGRTHGIPVDVPHPPGTGIDGRLAVTGQGASSGREPIAVLLKRLRRAQGLSQLRLTEQLCQASGRPTVTRHEISRWERGDRVPGPFWLDWLAVVLQVPLEDLEATVDRVQGRLADPDASQPRRLWLWQPVVAIDLLAALDRATTYDLRGMAHGWLAGPPDGWDGRVGRPACSSGSPAAGRTLPAASPAAPELGRLDGTGRDVLDLLEARLSRLRRADDLLGGTELSGRVDRNLREVIRVVKKIGSGRGRLHDRALRLVAGYAQLAGWVQADAGNVIPARRAYRVGLRAAAVAGDRELAAHMLGSLSNLSLESGNPNEALLLARTGLAGLAKADRPRCGDSARLRALLLHRAALAAARLGERPEAEAALAAAAQAADRAAEGDEPEWLYWLDEPQLAVMTGRCLAVLGRPWRAARLLNNRRHGDRRRDSALYGCWLARCYVALGEVEEAWRVAERVRVEVAGAGSARAESGVRQLAVLVRTALHAPSQRWLTGILRA